MMPADPSQPPILPDEACRLAALHELSVLDTPAEPGLDVITRLAADRFDCAIALVSLVDSDRQWFKSRHGLAAIQTPRATSFCAHAIAADGVMVVPDATQDPRFVANPLVTGAPYIRFYAAAPLVTGEGYRIGTLCIIDGQPRSQFSDRDATALTLMAGQVIELLESRRLRLSQRISELIGQTTTDAFVCTDRENRIIHWNRAAEHLFGWREDEALGQALDIIIPDRHRHGHATGVARLRKGAMPKLVGKTVEVPAICRAGHEIPIELSLGMWPAPDGLPEGFAAIIRDVSARKALEAERASTEALLAQQVAAIEASDDGIAITDPEGRFIFMNRAHARMFGHDSLDGLIGQPWSILYDAANARFIEDVAMPVLGAKGRWRGETRGLHKNGSAVAQEVSLSLSADGGIVCVTRDIGERLTLEREKARLRDQLTIAQRQEAVGQLASGIAHDFNNLIAAIAGTASLLENAAEPGVRRHAERIQSAAATAARLVDKLLTLGRRAPDRKPVDVGAMFGMVRDLVAPGLVDPQHRIALELPPGQFHVEADATELIQVVMNLVLNARDALQPDCEGRIVLGLRSGDDMPPCGVVRVGRLPQRPSVVISVSDNGAGIDAGHLEQIFQPFFTDKGPTGTGLGLAVVAGIVADAGGAIAVRSGKGEGTMFEIWWPLDAEVPAGRDLLPPAVADLGLLAGRSVLVVDDNPAMVETLVAMLEQLGAEPGPCLEAADALAAVEEDPDAWSLVITDYDMPGMSGAALAQAIRAIRADLPLLLLTALPNSFGRRAGDAALFDAVLGKPVGLEALLAGARTAMTVAAQRKR
jgi:PAS domain S-box-containing protein